MYKRKNYYFCVLKHLKMYKTLHMKFFLTIAASLFFSCVYAASPIKVGVLLPLHNDNGDGYRMVEYYRGLLFAIDSLKQEGISVDIVAHNLSEKANVDSILRKGDMNDRDIIFGPLYSKQMPQISLLSKQKGCKVVIPFSINTTELQGNPNLFQVYQQPDNMVETIVKNHLSLMQKNDKVQVVIIDCNDSTNFKRASLTASMKAYCDKNGVSYRITNVMQTDKAFTKAFNKKKKNVVVLNSASSPKMLEVFAKLNLLLETNPNLQISILGYNEWMMYEPFQLANFYKYDVYIPSTYYYNRFSQTIMNMENTYRKWFRQEPQIALPRFLHTGFDHGYYFIKGLAKYGKNFVGSKSQEVFTALQTPLHFTKVSTDGGYQNNFLMFLHYKKDSSIDMIKY